MLSLFRVAGGYLVLTLDADLRARQEEEEEQQQEQQQQEQQQQQEKELQQLSVYVQSCNTETFARNMWSTSLRPSSRLFTEKAYINEYNQLVAVVENNFYQHNSRLCHYRIGVYNTNAAEAAAAKAAAAATTAAAAGTKTANGADPSSAASAASAAAAAASAAAAATNPIFFRMHASLQHTNSLLMLPLDYPFLFYLSSKPQVNIRTNKDRAVMLVADSFAIHIFAPSIDKQEKLLLHTQVFLLSLLFLFLLFLFFVVCFIYLRSLLVISIVY